MVALRLLAAAPDSGSHNGEVFACAYTPDGGHVLTGGWDGHLRLWDAGTAAAVTAFQVSPKAVSACAVSPDGKQWLAGTLEGQLGYWEPMTHQQHLVLMAHTRPISAIRFSPDGHLVATASWDRSLVLWINPGKDRESRTLGGHTDIVAGCRFTPDGRQLLSWSHDATLRLWEVARARPLATLTGHHDRVTAAAVAPDGLTAVSGSRDGTLKLWGLAEPREVASRKLAGEVRACAYLLDGEHVVTADAQGNLAVLSVPDLEPRAELGSRQPVQCLELAPGGNQLVLGCDHGKARFVAVDGFDDSPLMLTPTRTSRQQATVLGRLFGKQRTVHAFACTCPACRQPFELPDGATSRTAACPHCRRSLRINVPTLVLQK